MEFDEISSTLSGIPNMSAEQGRSVYEHLRKSGATAILEIGTAHGVSAAYMAAALQENGGGKVTTVDSERATKLRDPQPSEVLARAGMTSLVDRVLVNDSSYTWWLKEQVEKHSDDHGNCTPQYDFCYLDGAHNWTIDGLAVILVEKLLKPGGWLLLDDLHWSYGAAASSFGPGQGPRDMGLSDGEMKSPHIEAVFRLLVQPHPSFGAFCVENGEWGWACKRPSDVRRLRIVRTGGLRRLLNLVGGSRR